MTLCSTPALLLRSSASSFRIMYSRAPCCAVQLVQLPDHDTAGARAPSGSILVGVIDGGSSRAASPADSPRKPHPHVWDAFARHSSPALLPGSELLSPHPTALVEALSSPAASCGHGACADPAACESGAAWLSGEPPGATASTAHPDPLLASAQGMCDHKQPGGEHPNGSSGRLPAATEPLEAGACGQAAAEGAQAGLCSHSERRGAAMAVHACGSDAGTRGDGGGAAALPCVEGPPSGALGGGVRDACGEVDARMCQEQRSSGDQGADCGQGACMHGLRSIGCGSVPGEPEGA